MKKDTLYKAFLNNKKKEEKDKKLIKKYNLSTDKVVINKKANTGIKLVSLIIDIIIKLIKLILIFVILILITIGATVILNKELLNYILNNIG